ncbi:MAG TPA: type II toxin-antitoxin system RelE/ParE family toxin [Bryobacteraceae bacterium]|nr:type II toxin-antitoxin system RelE/ParE family toxin [Bryobacteraceae bacterium]
MGHELRRPESDFLRDGIYELRVSLGGVHHRILYFFHGATAAVVSHGLEKERVVPPVPAEDDTAWDGLDSLINEQGGPPPVFPRVARRASVICRLEDAEYEGRGGLTQR